MNRIEKLVTLVFVLLLIHVVIYKTWLLNIPEWFSTAYEIGDIFYVLAMSYIASYIFYILVTFLPQRKQKKKTYEYVNHKVNLILVNFKDILSSTLTPKYDLDYLAGKISDEEIKKFININDYVTKIDYDNVDREKISQFFHTINFNDEGPITKIYVDENGSDKVYWGEYLLRNVNITHSLASDILKLLPLLDVHHVTLLTKIQESPYHLRLSMYSYRSRNENYTKDLGGLTDDFMEYYSLIKQLSIEFNHSFNNLEQPPRSHIYLTNIGEENPFQLR